MIKHLNLAQFKSGSSTQECIVDTHTFKVTLQEGTLYSQGETKRLNGPKSVVGPFDKIRLISKASGIES